MGRVEGLRWGLTSVMVDIWLGCAIKFGLSLRSCTADDCKFGLCAFCTMGGVRRVVPIIPELMVASLPNPHFLAPKTCKKLLRGDEI